MATKEKIRTLGDPKGTPEPGKAKEQQVQRKGELPGVKDKLNKSQMRALELLEAIEVMQTKKTAVEGRQEELITQLGTDGLQEVVVLNPTTNMKRRFYLDISKKLKSKSVK